MEDTFGRVQDYLRISLTDRCNLQCTYCMPDVPCFMPADQLLSGEEIAKIAAIFVEEFGIRKIRLTGGEPLLRKDTATIITTLSRLPVKLAVTTNGLLLDRFFPLFKKIGLSSLNISLDSLISENFREITKRDHFSKVFKHINQALADGFHVKINAVIKRGMNDHELLDFVAWTRNSPVHVRFIEYMPFSGNRWLWNQVVSYREILEKIGAVHELEKLEDDRHSTAKSFRVRGYQGTFAVISTVTDQFCGTCNRLRLTADGKMRNCLFSENEIDLLSAFRKGDDIRPLIIKCINSKQAERGGIGSFEKAGTLPSCSGGRSMTAIGG